MKRFFITLSLLTVSLAMASCDVLDALRGRSATEQAPALNPNELRVYANAYDGYVNIRQGPSTKHKIIGRLNNGDGYLVQLGVQGNWIAVKWQNTVGYVNSSIVGYTPWKPVYLGVDADWIQGIYTNFYTCYLIFNNGKYMHEHQYGDMEYGTWRFEGNEIVFTTKYVTEHGKSFDYYIGKETREIVDVAGQKIGDIAKRPYMTPREYDEYMAGECTTDAGSYSREVFNSAKKIVNKYVRLK